jgi:hypothetical protein
VSAALLGEDLAMLRFSPRAAALAISALVLVVPAAAPAKKAKPKPPSLAVIKKEMTAQYLGDDPVNYPTTRYSLKITHVSRGASRKGTYKHDGVPAGSKTIVFPTKVTMVYVVCYTDGTARRDDIVGKYGFFKDDFGEWTHREYSEQRTPGGADRLASCPL